MTTFGIILMVYGALVLLILVLRPPFIMNMKKLEIMEKMMGKKGLMIFLAVWGIAAFVVGYLIYN